MSWWGSWNSWTDPWWRLSGCPPLCCSMAWPRFPSPPGTTLKRKKHNLVFMLMIPACSPQVLSSCVLNRFLFILLGPLGKGPQYHEIGRSIATLMTDEVRSGTVLQNKHNIYCRFKRSQLAQKVHVHRLKGWFSLRA